MKKPLPEISPRAAIKIFDLQAWEVSQASSGQASEKNPERRSGASQFYIVWGKIYDDRRLDYTQMKLDSITNGEVQLTPEMREVYKTIGGTPHLDGQYTVFGEVTEGRI